MSVRVVTQPEADEQILALDAWWREHRPAAAFQVVDELARLVEELSEHPELGSPYETKGLSSIRRVRLRKTPYLLYYHHEPGSDLVTLLSLWSGVVKHGPSLHDPKRST